MGNTADSGLGDDIHNYMDEGTITFYDSCPSPYSDSTPTQGSAVDTDGAFSGLAFSYSDCLGDACVATPTTSDDGSNGDFYCVNSGVVGGHTQSGEEARSEATS